jgi:hypothetical protein
MLLVLGIPSQEFAGSIVLSLETFKVVLQWHEIAILKIRSGPLILSTIPSGEAALAYAVSLLVPRVISLTLHSLIAGKENMRTHCRPNCQVNDLTESSSLPVRLCKGQHLSTGHLKLLGMGLS